MTKKAISELVNSCYRILGLKETVIFADRLMYTGFRFATSAGISIGVDDMVIPSTKNDILSSAENDVREIQDQFSKNERNGSKIRHIVIFADEDFQSKNHLQIYTIRCYSTKKGQKLHIFGLSRTKECDQNAVFHRRHCLLAEIMKNWNKNDFVYAIDSDVIAPDYEGDWQWDYEEMVFCCIAA